MKFTSSLLVLLVIVSTAMATPLPQPVTHITNIQTTPPYVTEYNLTNKADLYDEIVVDNVTYISEYNQSRLWAYNQTNGEISTINFAPDITPLLFGKANDDAIWFLDYDYTTQNSPLDHVVRYDPKTENTTLIDLPYRAHAVNFGVSHGYAIVSLLTQKQIMLINTQTFATSFVNMTCTGTCGPGGADFDNDGNLWIANTLADQFMKYSFITGNFSYYSGIRQFISPTYVKFDTDNTFWTGSHAGDKLARVNITDMSYKVYTSPQPNIGQYPVSGVNKLAILPHDVWFAEHFVDRIGRLDRDTGTVLNYYFTRNQPLVANLAVDKNKVWYADTYGIFGYFDMNKVPTVQIKPLGNYTISDNPQVPINLQVSYLSGIEDQITFSTFATSRGWRTIGVADDTTTYTLNRGEQQTIPTKLAVLGRIDAGFYHVVVGIKASSFTANMDLYLTVTRNWTDADFNTGTTMPWDQIIYFAIPVLFIAFLYINRRELATLIQKIRQDKE